MKLEKREITLNEKDSIKDMSCFEEHLLAEYSKGNSQEFRKETVETLSVLRMEMEEIIRRIADLKTEETGS